MADRVLHEYRILVVEDEYMLADELACELADVGAVVLGPGPSIKTAMALLEREALPDAAILDVNLGGVHVFPLADALVQLRVPLIFTTGYDPGALPERYQHIPTCEKPIDAARIVAAIRQEIDAQGQ